MAAYKKFCKWFINKVVCYVEPVSIEQGEQHHGYTVHQ